MDDKKNLDVLKTQIPELGENRLESIWDMNSVVLAQVAEGWCPGSVIGSVG